jgi:hypothetical protein
MGAKKQGRGRTWGTGSVSSKGRGKWLLRTSHRSLEGEDGTRERIRVNRVVHARSKHEAEQLLAEMLTGSREAEAVGLGQLVQTRVRQHRARAADPGDGAPGMGPLHGARVQGAAAPRGDGG